MKISRRFLPWASGFKQTRWNKDQYIDHILKMCVYWNIPQPPERSELERMPLDKIKLVLREIELRVGNYAFHRKTGCW